MDLNAKASLGSVIRVTLDVVSNGNGAFVELLKFVACPSLIQQDADAFVNQLRSQLLISTAVENGPLLTLANYPCLLLIIEQSSFGSTGGGAVEIDNPNQYLSPLNLGYSTVPKLYTLQSVIVHEGAVNSGRYYAHLRSNNSNQWFKADDKGNRFASTEAEALGVNNASMLFYVLQE
ncbi:hypothetical protein Ancab_010529 [Ancistrocladus abbreviatus]